MVDYELIIKNIEQFTVPRISARKKFKRKLEDCAIQLCKVYCSFSNSAYNEKIYNKFYNHLKCQGKNGSTLQKLHRHFDGNYIKRIKKSKGLFNAVIYHNHILSEPEVWYNIYISRNSISLKSEKDEFNLDDKSERFSALLSYDFDYNNLLIIQKILKKKRSGTYTIYTE